MPNRHDLTFDPRTIDTWAHLSKKAGLDGRTDPAWRISQEIPPEHHRRFSAYNILSAYAVNNARHVLTGITENRLLEHREYGDSALIIDRIVAGVLGNDLDLDIPAFTAALADPPSTDDMPQPPPEGAADIETLIYERTLDVWQAEKTAELEAWVEAREQLADLRKSRDWLYRWMGAEQAEGKITENEQDYVVPLGDGVLEIQWSTRKNRPRLHVHPPDAYMPELGESGEFPDVVHLVWQPDITGDDDYEEGDTVYRRTTYRLVDVDTLDTQPARPNYLEEDDRFDQVCVISDIEFRRSDHSEGKWQEFGQYVTEWPDEAGRAFLNEDDEPLTMYPLGLDFIPIVHLPNTLSSAGHYGTSSLARVIGLLDQIQQIDTNLALAGALAGTPMLGVEGRNVDPDRPISIRPGKVLEGKFTALDMSSSVTSLIGELDKALERLSVNVQIPESMLGRLDESGEFPSGVALRLSFLAFVNLVDKMRLARKSKYQLLFKMVQRMWKAYGDEDFEIVDAGLAFGEFIPADITAIAESVASLLTAKGLSRSTAVEVLKEAGLPIPDVGLEVEAIANEDTEGLRERADAAKIVFEATGSDSLTAQILGVEVPGDALLPEAEQPLTDPLVTVTGADGGPVITP